MFGLKYVGFDAQNEVVNGMIEPFNLIIELDGPNIMRAGHEGGMLNEEAHNLFFGVLSWAQDAIENHNNGKKMSIKEYDNAQDCAERLSGYANLLAEMHNNLSQSA